MSRGFGIGNASVYIGLVQPGAPVTLASFVVYEGNPALTNDVRNDFNGDGRSDILWRNVDGQMSNWLGQANGGFVANNANAAAVVPVAWQIAGTGDFNGDGRDDVLWRNVDGQISNCSPRIRATPEHANAAAVSPPHALAVTGDFNGDGATTSCGATIRPVATGSHRARRVHPNDANAAFWPTDWHVAGPATSTATGATMSVAA